MTPVRGFSERVRQELSRLDPGRPSEDRAELAALLVLSGRWTREAMAVESRSGATVRRIYRLLDHRHGLRPELRVTMPADNRRRVRYGLRLSRGLARVTGDLALAPGEEGVEVAAGVTGLPPFVTDVPEGVAYLRGAVIAAGSVSDPDREPHLEIAARTGVLARDLADAAGEWLSETVTVPEDGRHRVVVKSGRAIGELLGRVGATGAYLDWEEQRLRRRVRAEATRLANADAANVRRTIEAATEQARQIRAAIAAVGWEGLDEDLRQVAAARLTDPSASLAEIGRRCDPPVGKSAVHRRLRRLAEMAGRGEDAPAGG